jgi:hypothetical protein
MITEEQLARRLGSRPEYPAASARPLTEIDARARSIRRARRARRAGTLTVLAGGLGVGFAAVRGLPGLPGGAGGPGKAGAATQRSVGPAASAPTSAAKGPASGDCLTGYASAKRLEDVSDLLYLPSAAAARVRMVKPVLAREDRSACAPAPVPALWYSLSGATVTRALQVSGPGAIDPYRAAAASSGGAFMGDTATVPVRGGTGTVYLLTTGPYPVAMLSWKEPDGTSWWADGEGLTRDQLLGAVAALQISGGRLTPEPVPGFDAMSVAPSGGQSSRTVRTFMAMFGNINEDQGGWTLSVSRGQEPDRPTSGTVLVDVGGHPAWWTPRSTASGVLSWTDDGGRAFQVSGTITEQRALAVARSLVAVRPDDARFAGLREAATPSSGAPRPGTFATTAPGPSLG